MPPAPLSAGPRRFLLAAPPDGGPVRLAPGEAEHAQRVLRLAAGDRLLGLDGQGGTWPLVVAQSDRRGFEVERDGEPRRDPAPGEPGSGLPWIEVLVAWPRGERAEQMVDRLVQLGAAGIRPLAAARATPEARGAGARRLERVERIAREACKQSGRAWLPRLGSACTVAEGLGSGPADAIVLDPRAEHGLPASVAACAEEAPGTFGTRARPLRLWVGPEGGFAPDELAALALAGARPARLGPHVLRIETAAEAAVAVAVASAPAR